MEQIFETLVALLFGAVFGSYATLFAYRLPRGESCFGRYFGPKSRCPKCENIIPTSDLIPLFNWIITMGKCRICKTKIPRIHLFVEFATTILFLITYLNFGFSEKFIPVALMAVALVVLLVCDYTHKAFPYQALNFLLVFAVLSRVLSDFSILPMLFNSIFGMIAAIIFYKILYKKFPYLFIDQNHFFDYLKLILIASLVMNFSMFLYYLSVVSLALLMLSIFKLLQARNSQGLGYVFILPFIWIAIIAPHSFG